jgi:membrane protein YdbS with pleckstrin-like domain
MKSWPWQKWIGKLLPFGVAVGAALWSFIESEPTWWVVVVAAATGLVQWILATFPVKE